MRRRLISAAKSALLGLVVCAMAQNPAPKLDRVIGEVKTIDAGAKQISVKLDAGAVVTAVVDEKTLYLRVPPGEKDLKKAARIALDNVAVGDRAFVRGHFSEDQKSIAAVAVIIMTKAELAQKQEHDRDEWKRRSVAGPVTAVNPDAKEITVTTRSREGAKAVVVEIGEHVDFRRYAPESVRFSDATPSSFADLKVGDQLRALGEKNEDGTRIKAEVIVSGSFRNIAGVIKAINAETKEITLTDLVAHKPVTVRVTADSAMRRLPPQMAAMLARRMQGAAGGAAGQGAGARPANAAAGVPCPLRPDGAKPGAGAPPAEPGPGGGDGATRRGNMDFQDMLERLPPMKVEELKAGDAVMLSGSSGADSGRVTAINLLAGVEPLLTAAPQGGQQIFGSWNFDIGPQE
jgi:hypothetical protein